jgi:hypothetical protein
LKCGGETGRADSGLQKRRRLRTPDLNLNNIELLLFFVAPGFISLKVWGILTSAPRFRLSESLMEAVVYSSFNFLALIGFFDKLKSFNSILAYGVFFIICPIIWPGAVYCIAKIRVVKTRITPTSWDHYFNEGEDCFVLIHMKDNEEMIGGLFSGKSFASSYPEKEDLYLEELWKVDENGKFMEKVESTNGLLVNFDEIKYIEFFRLGTPLETLPC